MCAWQGTKPGWKKHLVRSITLSAVLAVAWAGYQLERNLTGVVLSLAQAQARAMAVQVLNEAAEEIVLSGVTYSDLMAITADDSGQVRLIQANTPMLNQLSSRASLTAQEKLSSLESRTVKVPLGSALGVSMLAGAGPKISVAILPVGAVIAGFTTEFESAGINQTRHKISLTLTAHVQLVIPSGAKEVEAVIQVAVAESIIVGQVPQTYTDVGDNIGMLDLAP